MDNLPLFNAAEAARLRDLGLAKVSSFPNDTWVQRARAIAIMFAAKNGEVTINDVLKMLPRPESVHPNACGAVMKCKELVLTSYTKSDKVSSHARRIGVYSLRDDVQ